MGAPIYAPTEWRFAVLGKVAGNWKKITMLSGLAADLELLYQLNRSTMLTFSVPSEDPRVCILHTDGHPYIDVGRRWILGYRKSPPSLAPYPGNWELKYAGRIWQVQDTADGTTGRTMVTCFDALKHLEKRIARMADGTFRKQVRFWAVPGTTIAKDLVDRTQTYAGTCRIDTDGGVWVDSSIITAEYDQKYVLPALLDITNTGTFDLNPTYLDGSAGDFMTLGGKPRLGSDKPGVRLGYAAPPRRATNYDRTISLDNLANSVGLWGKTSKGPFVTQEDTDSQDEFDVFEDFQVMSSIYNPTLLQMLADEEVFLRKSPNDLITIVPTPEDAPRFFNEYFIGDTIQIRSGMPPYPETREAITGQSRVYGVRLTIDNDYGEHVTEMIASQQAES